MFGAFFFNAFYFGGDYWPGGGAGPAPGDELPHQLPFFATLGRMTAR